MTTDRRLDLVCVSYLADAQVLHVDRYPAANAGAVVQQASASIAGDGPLTAALASARGLRVGLITNSVGADPAGHRLLAHLERAKISHRIPQNASVATPHLTVVTDDADTRTWFASLQHVDEDLCRADLQMVGEARLLYVDCYRVLADAAARVVAAASATPLLLNLGGDEPDDRLVELACTRRICAVQTSLDEARAAYAQDLAADLFARLRPEAAIVTVGGLGVVARSRLGVHVIPAPEVPHITHTHGAGAAFSAGYAHALLTGADVDAALRAGCAAGTEHCAGPSAAIPRQLPTATFAA